MTIHVQTATDGLELEVSADSSFGGPVTFLNKHEARDERVLMVSLVVDGAAVERRRVELADAIVISTGERLLRSNFEFHECSILTGRVVDDSDDPVVGVHVALFADRPNGQRSLLAETMTSRLGEFMLHDLPVSEGSLLLTAVLEGFRPATHPVASKLGVEDVGRLPLSREERLSGRIHNDWFEGEGWMLVVTRQGRERLFDLGPYRMQWVGDDLEFHTVSLLTSRSFEFSGLAPGGYRLRFSRPGGCGLPGLSPTAREVVVPAEGIDVVLQEAVMLFDVRDLRGDPIPRVDLDVLLREEETFACGTDREGLGAIVGRPGTTYRVTVSKTGYAPETLSVRCPDPGEAIRTRIVLQELRLGTVVLELSGQGSGEVEDACLHFEPVGDEETSFHREVSRRPAEPFRVERVPAGVYELRVRPHGCRETKGWFQDAVLPLSVEADEETTATASLERGGRLTVRITGEEGAVLPAVCIVEDERGDRVDVLFVAVGDVAIMDHERVPHSLAGYDGFVDVLPPLSPGRYRLEATLEGYEPASQQVLLESGAERAVELRLAKQR